jgi:hypothetical protein
MGKLQNPCYCVQDTHPEVAGVASNCVLSDNCTILLDNKSDTT